VKPFPIVLSAPSGGGKTTIARRLLDSRADVGYSVSCTTRAPRVNETDGQDYHFLSLDRFAAERAAGAFAEWADVHGHLYGTLRREVQRVLGDGRHVLMDIDVQGARQFIDAFPDTVTVFVLPPSAETLVQRLSGRNSEAPERLLVRLRNAQRELAEAWRYQYIVVNDSLDRAVTQIGAIIDAETVRHARVQELEAQVTGLVDALERQIAAMV
jgi:guanylate kinase